MSVTGFFARFPDENACLEHVFATKWGDHSPCPDCGQIGRWFRVRGSKKWQHACRRQFSVLEGTVFYRSNISLLAWFYALLLFANASCGIRTALIRKQLGLGHNGSLRLCRQIRIHMASMPRPEMMGGPGKTVNVDEVHLKYLTSPDKEEREAAIVLGIACEGKVICGIVKDRKASTLIPLLQSRIRAGSTIITDTHLAYHRLASLGFDHVRINHSVAFHDFKGKTNNPIEVFWSSLRRNLNAYRQISPDNLWTYLAEAEFRYNRRRTPDLNFSDLIGHFPQSSRIFEDRLSKRFIWT